MKYAINQLRALGKKIGLLAKRDKSLKLKAFKQPMYILDNHEGAKFRTTPEGGAFIKFFGGIERPTENRSDLLNQAFLNGTEITKDEYEAL